MLDSLKQQVDLPMNFKPKIIEDPRKSKLQFGNKVTKNEEYYIEQCPIELISILLKYIIEMLTSLEIISVVEEIPHSISRLLYMANAKSDLSTEKEIFENYLLDSKKAMDDELRNLQQQIVTQDQLRDLIPLGSLTKNSSVDVSSAPVKKEDPLSKNYNILGMKAFENPLN